MGKPPKHFSHSSSPTGNGGEGVNASQKEVNGGQQGSTDGIFVYFFGFISTLHQHQQRGNPPKHFPLSKTYVNHWRKILVLQKMSRWVPLL